MPRSGHDERSNVHECRTVGTHVEVKKRQGPQGSALGEHCRAVASTSAEELKFSKLRCVRCDEFISSGHAHSWHALAETREASGLANNVGDDVLRDDEKVAMDGGDVREEMREIGEGGVLEAETEFDGGEGGAARDERHVERGLHEELQEREARQFQLLTYGRMRGRETKRGELRSVRGDELFSDVQLSFMRNTESQVLQIGERET